MYLIYIIYICNISTGVQKDSYFPLSFTQVFNFPMFKTMYTCVVISVMITVFF